MSHINEKEFFDEYDNMFEIKKLIKKDRYKKAFKLLNQLFFEQRIPRITVKEIQEKLGIYDRSVAWQILESFRILNTLKKIKRDASCFYSPINQPYWEVCADEPKKTEDVKKVKKSGSR